MMDMESIYFKRNNRYLSNSRRTRIAINGLESNSCVIVNADWVLFPQPHVSHLRGRDPAMDI